MKIFFARIDKRKRDKKYSSGFFGSGMMKEYREGKKKGSDC